MTMQPVDYIATREHVRAYLDRALLDVEARSRDESVLYDSVKHKLMGSDARLVAHYYVDPQIQQLAEETNGLVADSLEMARFGARTNTRRLIVVERVLSQM